MAGPLPIADPAPADGLLPKQASNGAENRTWHAYVHIPFCSVRCGYCDFNTYTSSELRGVKQSDFADSVIAEIHFSRTVLDASGLPARPLESVFFGGGTPTQLPAAHLGRILEALRESFAVSDKCEITTEANPDNLDENYAADLAAAGFTRVSIGMQSAVSAVLKTLDRTHTPENVGRAVAAAKAAGLNKSVDLIYGAPGETLEDWRYSIEAALQLDTDHISAYSLIVEEGTKLARQIKSGELAGPDEDLNADKYELAERLLTAGGFEAYEVSNWARGANHRSKHNLAYWRGQDWWGFGPGAHSHVGGVRWWNVKHPASYVQPLQKGQSPAAGRETLDERTRLIEQLLLEIRIIDGVAVEVIKSLNPNAAKPLSLAAAGGLIDAKSLIQGRVILTLKGRLLADALVRDLLG